MLLEDFFNYYEYNVETLDLTYVPKDLLNKFHEYNDCEFLYSGSDDYRQIPHIRDWTTDIHTADRFANEDGFIVQISKRGFIRRFSFVSMDLIYDYLVSITTKQEEKDRLQDYISESEVYAINLK